MWKALLQQEQNYMINYWKNGNFGNKKILADARKL